MPNSSKQDSNMLNSSEMGSNRLKKFKSSKKNSTSITRIQLVPKKDLASS